MIDALAGIEIRIDVLEVEGLNEVDALRLRHDVEQDLARLVRESDVPFGALRSRSLVAVDIDSGAHANEAGQDSLGQRVADAIYRALIQ